MKTVLRIGFVLGVLAGIGWLVSRFGPEMMEQCRAMMEEQGVEPEQIKETVEEELAEAQA